MISGIPPVGNGSSMSPQKTQQTSSTLGKDDFLKLLTMQLKAQNPMKPIDNMEFATQLAQFSQLEQLANIRSILENQNSIFEALAENLQATSMSAVLGEYATAYSNKVSFDGEKQVTLGFKLDSSMQSGEVVIKDASGKEVRRMPLDSTMLSSGEHVASWDGTDNQGNKLPKGEYTFQVVVSNRQGSTFNAETFTYGKIQAIRFKPEGTVIVIDDVEIPLKNLISINTKV